MTSLKGKAAEQSFARRSARGGFRIYSEDEKHKTEAPALAESAVGSKVVPLTVANDSKRTLKSTAKSKGKGDNAANRFAPRKALTDLSNVTSNVSRIKVYDGSKPMKNERNALLDRLSVATASKSVKTKNSDPKSVVTTNRTTKKSLVPTRKSSPVLKKEKATEASRNMIKAKAYGSATLQTNNAKSHLQRDVGSDGFVMPSKVQSNAAAHILPRSFKPIVKTAVRASISRRTPKSKGSSGCEKPVSTAAISSEEKEAECSQQENNAAVISNEASQRDIPTNGNSEASTNMPEILAQKKTKRRRSYTSLLMTRKLLEDCSGVKEEEKLPGIDDDTNPLEVAQYIDEIYQYYWISEAHSPSLENYMSIQTDITPAMRGILINWLIEVHLKFDLMQETLYLMVTLLDRYLSEVQIKKNDMQLIGLTTLLLASKYEDYYWHPRVKDLISISAETYTSEQMLKMEKLVLKKLKFRLNAPTPYVFMLRFIKAAQSDTKLEHLAFYLIELSMVEYEALKFKPSLLCAAAIYVARCTLQMTPSWTQLLCKHARYDVSEIRECAEMILRFQRAAGSGKLKVTYEKYMSGDLSEVAAIKPLDRLPST